MGINSDHTGHKYPRLPRAGRDGHESSDGVLPGGRIVHVDGVVDLVKGHAGKDAGQAVAVVAVHVREAYARDLGDGESGVGHLPLRALSGIEEKVLAIPAQQVPGLGAGAGAGRDLQGGAEDDELTRDDDWMGLRPVRCPRTLRWTRLSMDQRPQCDQRRIGIGRRAGSVYADA